MTTELSPAPTLSHNLFADKKFDLIAVGSVLALHAIVCYSLLHTSIKPALPKTPLLKTTPPLDISFVSSPKDPNAALPKAKPTVTAPKTVAPSVTKPTQPRQFAKVKPNPPPKSNIQAQPTSQTKATVTQAPKPTKPTTLPIERRAILPKKLTTDIEVQTKTVTQQPSVDAALPTPPQEVPVTVPPATKHETQSQQLPPPQPTQAAQPNQEIAQMTQQHDQTTPQQTQPASQIAIQRAQQDALTQQKAIEQQAQAKKLAEAAARQQAAAEQIALEAAKAKQAAANAEKDQQKTVQNNMPVTFSAGDASWRRPPNFSCNSEDTNGAALTAAFRYTVDKQGNASVIQTKSTGNPRLDRQLLAQAKSGKFHPFTQGGIPVVGMVNLPVRCE